MNMQQLIGATLMPTKHTVATSRTNKSLVICGNYDTQQSRLFQGKWTVLETTFNAIYLASLEESTSIGQLCGCWRFQCTDFLRRCSLKSSIPRRPCFHVHVSTNTCPSPPNEYVKKYNVLQPVWFREIRVQSPA